MAADTSAIATAAIGAGAGLIGVVLGFGGNLIRDRRREHFDREESNRDVRAAARLVWMEIVEFQTATHVAAANPRLVKDETVIAPLHVHQQLDRYLAVLARERDFDVAAIEHAYTSARYAADALLADAPPDETRDAYQEAFANGLTALAVVAEISPASATAVQHRTTWHQE